jgi:hypothetical protein
MSDFRMSVSPAQPKRLPEYQAYRKPDEEHRLLHQLEGLRVKVTRKIQPQL